MSYSDTIIGIIYLFVIHYITEIILNKILLTLITNILLISKNCPVVILIELRVHILPKSCVLWYGCYVNINSIVTDLTNKFLIHENSTVWLITQSISYTLL